MGKKHLEFDSLMLPSIGSSNQDSPLKKVNSADHSTLLPAVLKPKAANSVEKRLLQKPVSVLPAVGATISEERSKRLNPLSRFRKSFSKKKKEEEYLPAIHNGNQGMSPMKPKNLPHKPSDDKYDKKHRSSKYAVSKGIDLLQEKSSLSPIGKLPLIASPSKPLEEKFYNLGMTDNRLPEI